MIEDEKIIEMFFERSEQGIRELDIKYGKVCHKLSYNIVNSRQDAEECVNDAYLGAWNAIPPANPHPLLTYICKIVRNISLKIYYRKEAAKRNSTYTIAMEEIEACIADPNTVEAEIEARELARIIESFLDTLTVENRVIFMRRYWFTDSNLNHTGIYLYSKGKIMIHLTFDYKTDEKCTTPGQYLKYHRTFQGLSTRELAEKVGIVPATLVLYENDRHPIKYSTAVALANVLGIDRNRLLDEYTAFVDYPYFSLLKKVRQDLSLTQIQMAELIGIGQTSYSGWEREIRVPRRKEYDKILAALKKLRVNVDTYLCQSASI